MVPSSRTFARFNRLWSIRGSLECWLCICRITDWKAYTSGENRGSKVNFSKCMDFFPSPFDILCSESDYLLMMLVSESLRIGLDIITPNSKPLRFCGNQTVGLFDMDALVVCLLIYDLDTVESGTELHRLVTNWLIDNKRINWKWQLLYFVL